MQSNLFIKYKGIDPKRDSDIDLKLLGESLIGFNQTIHDLFNISNIKGGINIKATKVREGTLIFDILTNLTTHIPFEHISDYANFLNFIYDYSSSSLTQQIDHLRQIQVIHRKANDYFANNPLDLEILKNALKYGFPIYLIKMIRWGAKQKQYPIIKDNDGEIPKSYGVKLHKLIKNGGYKKAIVPFTENELEEIAISNDRDFRLKSTINNSNFEHYLSEDEKILPQLQNGEVYTFAGRIVSLQSTRGEYMQFRVADFPPRYHLLVAIPEEGKNTEHYKEYYKENVTIRAKVIRESVYKKPKLQIIKITQLQKPML